MSRHKSVRELLDRAKTVGIEQIVSEVRLDGVVLSLGNGEVLLFGDGSGAELTIHGKLLITHKNIEFFGRIARGVASWMEGEK